MKKELSQLEELQSNFYDKPNENKVIKYLERNIENLIKNTILYF